MTKTAAAVSALHAHALRLLAARPQSRAELLQKLARVCERQQRRRRAAAAAAGGGSGPARGADEAPAPLPRELAEAAVARLERTSAALADGAERLVDDAAFAAFWASQRALHRPKARAVVAGELRAKGVDASLVAAALSTHNEHAAALAAARRGRAGGREGRALQLYLARKGFVFRSASAAIAALDGEATAALDGEGTPLR